MTRTRVTLTNDEAAPGATAEAEHYRLADEDATNCHTCEHVVLHGEEPATCSLLVDAASEPLAVDPQHVCDLWESATASAATREDGAMRLTRTQIVAMFERAAHAVATGESFEPYPWDQCIQDQLDKGSDQDSAEAICGTIKAENAAIEELVRMAAATPADPSTPYTPAPYDSGDESTSESVTCPNCGKGDEADALYCDQCGYHLAADTDYHPGDDQGSSTDAVTCPECNAGDAADAIYCDQCGYKLSGALGVKPIAPATDAGDDGTAPAEAGGSASAGQVAAAFRGVARQLADASGPDEAADSAVDQALTALGDALQASITAQEADPDATDPNDVKVMAGLKAMATLFETVQADQAADSDASKGAAAAAPSADGDEAGSGGPLTTTDGDDDGDATTAAAMADGDVPGNAAGVAGDADDSPPGPGDLEADLTCQNPNCGHPASMHADTADGVNTGACTDPNDSCPGMVPPANQVNGPGDESEGETTDESGAEGGIPVASSASGEHGGKGPGDHAARGTAMADAPAAGAGDDAAASAPAPADGTSGGTAPAVSGNAPASGEQLPPPNPDPSTVTGPMFTIPVGVIEGLPTGDGRGISEGALDWLDPPRPLMGLFTATHDPNGFDPNDPAEWIGVIESFSRTAGDNGVIMAQGHLLTTDEGINAAQILEQMGRCPVSADIVGRRDRPIETTSVLDDLMPEIPVLPGDIALDGVGDGTEGEDEPEPIPGVMETLTQGTVAGFTVVPTAAFEDCFIVLGDGSDQPPVTELVNRTPVVPEGAPADAEPAPVTASMGYVLHDIDDCAPCATGRPVLVASSGGPLAPPRSWFDDPGFTAGDVRLRETVDDRSGRLSGKFACPPTITEDGEVLMHLAQWGVCHTGPQYKGKCMLAPRNTSGYAYWYQGAQVLTAEGEAIDVGPITIGTGHAGLNLGLGATLAHYDNTGTAVAYGTVGEDEFGIWFHGALAPDATPEQVYKLRASVPSGDWRPRGTREELCACLMVNRAGFPQARAHSVAGRKTALVAAGAPMFEVPVEPGEPHVLTVEERLAALEGSTSPLLPLAHDAIVKRVSALRG